jgi:hypothetical protein
MPKPDDLDLSVLFPSDWIKAADLGGRQYTLTVTSVAQEVVKMTGGRASKCVVLRFEKTRKGLICNKTNAYALAILLSPNLAKPNGRDWIGHRIALCADMDVNRKTKEDIAAIRIAGSPDASEERAHVYGRAWRGERKGGELCHRLKAALATAAIRGLAPPVEPRPVEPEPEPAAEGAPPSEEPPDIFADVDVPM